MTTAVIYNTETIKIVKRFDSLRGAKAALTRARKSGRMRVMSSFGYGALKTDEIAKLDVCTMGHFLNEVDEWTTVKNLMSGDEASIRKSDVGSCVDPSTERYWSM